MLEFPIINRKTGQIFKEKTFGEKWIEWSYQTSFGRALTGNSVVQRIISAFVGAYMRSPLSKGRIEAFIREFEINMGDFADPMSSFQSFNDFFIRQLRPGARAFPKDPMDLGCPAEGRVSIYRLDDLETPLYFKGKKLSLVQVLGGDADIAAQFLGGWAYVIRLCPVDYHRFHFADSGKAGSPRRISGLLESVNPLSLYKNSLVFGENERQLTLQQSDHFGCLAYLEVGALCVGTIQQSFESDLPQKRGQEKGYFEFGGSTQILLTESHISPCQDLVENSAQNTETLVQLGEKIAQNASPAQKLSV
jgi:phosphatidylserine decarboxylase